MGQQLYVSDNHIKVIICRCSLYFCIRIYDLYLCDLYLCICRWNASHTAWAPKIPLTDCACPAVSHPTPRYNKIPHSLSSWHEPQMWTHVVSSNSDTPEVSSSCEFRLREIGVHSNQARAQRELSFIQTECVLEARQRLCDIATRILSGVFTTRYVSGVFCTRLE